MIKKYLEVGQIVGTHGVHGEMRVQPWADSPDFLTKFSTLYLDEKGEKSLSTTARVHGNMVLLKAKDVETVAGAEAFRGKILYINRNDVKLPKGKWFVQDLVGCTVVDADTKEELGILTEIITGVANDVWSVRQGEKDYLVPAIESVIVEKNPEKGVLTIRPMKGIFDDEN